MTITARGVPGSDCLRFDDGATAPVSQINTGQIRYNNLLRDFEKSINGVGWTSLALAVQRRVGVSLLGVQDGVNTEFWTTDYFVSIPGGDTIAVYLNGVRLRDGYGYIVGESGGVGTGFDTILFDSPPAGGVNADVVFVDYTVA